MRLYEYQAKDLLKEFTIKVPRGTIIYAHEEVIRILESWKRVDVFFVKAQLLEGKRGKRGLIKEATRETLQATCKSMFKKKVNNERIKALLIEKKQYIREEHYLSLTLDRNSKQYLLLYSPKGGVDIEEQQQLKKYSFYEYDERLIKQTIKDRDIRELVRVVFAIMKKFDATLIELNPLAYTVNGFVAVDCKIIIDNNALYRQEDIKKLDTEKGTLIEERAKKKGIQYVDVDDQGTIGIIGNGAGLVMATLDTVAAFGGKPTNFLDVGGGTDATIMSESMHLVMAAEPKGILISIFGGITHCDEIAKGIIEYKKKYGLHIPVVIRLTGTNEAEGIKILEQENIQVVNSLDKAAKKIIELTK